MELDDPVNPVCPRCQEGGPEMKGVLFLAEPRAWNDTDSGGIEEAETVEFVGLAIGRFGRGNGLFGKRDGWEEVHGALEGEETDIVN